MRVAGHRPPRIVDRDPDLTARRCRAPPAVPPVPPDPPLPPPVGRRGRRRRRGRRLGLGRRARPESPRARRFSGACGVATLSCAWTSRAPGCSSVVRRRHGRGRARPVGPGSPVAALVRPSATRAARILFAMTMKSCQISAGNVPPATGSPRYSVSIGLRALRIADPHRDRQVVVEARRTRRPGSSRWCRSCRPRTRRSGRRGRCRA